MVRTIILEPKMIVLICDFDCFNVRIKTSNQDTFGRAWGGGVNGTQHVAIGAQLFMLKELALAFLLAQLGLSAGDTSHMQNCYSGINLDNLEFGPPL